MLGKGIFVYAGQHIFNSDIGKFINYVGELKLDHILIRLGGATSERTSSYPGKLPIVVDLLRREFPSLQVWGWHYVYCGAWTDKFGFNHFDRIATPEQEADFAKSMTRELKLDGYVINAERELKLGYGDSDKAKNPYFRGQRFMNRLKGIGVPVGLSTYRYPDLHREYAWAAFLEGSLVNYHMPQVYWGKYANAPMLELLKSVRQLKAKKDLPIIPTGRAYIGDGHKLPEAKEINQFNRTVKSLDLQGCNYWAMDFLIRHQNGPLWAIEIKNFDFDGVVTDPTPTEPMVQNYRITGDWLRKRTGPGLEFPIKGHLRTGDKISVYDKQYKDYIWGRIHPTESLWCALNYASPT